MFIEWVQWLGQSVQKAALGLALGVRGWAELEEGDAEDGWGLPSQAEMLPAPSTLPDP